MWVLCCARPVSSLALAAVTMLVIVVFANWAAAQEGKAAQNKCKSGLLQCYDELLDEIQALKKRGAYCGVSTHAYDGALKAKKINKDDKPPEPGKGYAGAAEICRKLETCDDHAHMCTAHEVILNAQRISGLIAWYAGGGTPSNRYIMIKVRTAGNSMTASASPPTMPNSRGLPGPNITLLSRGATTS